MFALKNILIHSVLAISDFQWKVMFQHAQYISLQYMFTSYVSDMFK